MRESCRTVIRSIVAGVAGMVGSAASLMAQPPPPNDDCGAAKQIQSAALPYEDSIATANATTAPTDPIQTCVLTPSQHENSVWYRFTAQNAVRLVAETFGSDYDTLVTVYGGTCENVGPELACNDDMHGEPSRVSVDVAAGQTILFEITRFDNGGSGDLLFRLVASNVANDDCADAAPIGDLPFTSTIDTRDATSEPEDPAQSCGPAAPAQNHNSVWYRYTAPAGQTRTLIATTFGSRYETALTAYRGTCGALQEAACDSNSNDSEIEVTVQPGQTIYFEATQVLTFEPPGGGDLMFNVSAAVPGNDQCAAATQIPSGSGFSQTIHTSGATSDPNDPFQTCVGPQATNAKSVWYRYTAPAEGIFTASTAGSSYDTVLSVLAGSCLALQEITCDDDTIGRTSRVTFSLAAGETVYLEATEVADTPAGGVLVLRFAQGTAGACRGDCNVDGEVAIDDLLQMVAIAISDLPLSRCEIGDEDDDGDIGLDDIIPAVSDALSGCR